MAQAFALLSGQIWDGVADEPQRDIAIVVRDGHIEELRATTELPADIERREFPACTIIPGLIDAHVHYSDVCGPAFLAAGVTTVRDVGNDLEWILAQRAAHAADSTIGPAIYCCEHLHDSEPPIWPHMGRGHADPESLRASIRHHVERGVDQIKLYARLDLEMLRAGVDESHRLNKFVVAHLGKCNAREAIPTGLDEFEHLDQCEVAWREAAPGEDDAMIDLLLQHGTIINPTFVVWDRIGRLLESAFFNDRRREWVHPCHRDIWDRFVARYPDPEQRARYQLAIPHLKRFMRRAHARGVTVAIGTDAPFVHLMPGFSLHDELAMYIDAGLRPVDALRSATSVNAKVLEIEEKTGRIAPGLLADFAIIEGDPLRSINEISNIVATMHAGTLMQRPELFARAKAHFEVHPGGALTADLLGYVNSA